MVIFVVHYVLAFFFFWLYAKIIYHRSRVDKRHLILAHFMFSSLNAIFYSMPSFNLPYWVVVPLLLNSTRIELWFESLMIHMNNLGYAQITTLKNALFLIPLFHWADKLNCNATFVLNVLGMDVLHFVLYEIRLFKKKTAKRTSYVGITTIS